MTDDLIRGTGLRRVFHADGRDVAALDGVDISISKGERVAVVGPSGAGKTTLLHVLGALDPPDKGTVTFEGADLYGRAPGDLARIRAERFGFVFQDHHLLPEFSAMENILLAHLIAGRPAADGRLRAMELLGRLGLADRAGHRPAQLSGGERQRVAVARALMNKPALLLADEPTGSLDRDTGLGVFEEFLALQEDCGAALVLVTHTAELAARCSRSVTLRAGRST